MNLASDLNDIAVTRAILLQQLGTSMSNDVKGIYLEVLDDLRERILKHENLDPVRVKQIIKEIKELTFKPLPLYDELKELAVDEAQWLVASTNSAAGAELFRAIPTESVLISIGANASMEGGLIKDWFKGLDNAIRFKLQNSIKMSLVQGESTRETAERFNKITGISMNEAETLVRTGIASVTNGVREEVYKANEDIVSGREHNSVLDNRTSKFICAPRDGARWDNNGKGLNEKGKMFAFQVPPLHPRCRSVLLSLLKNWDELDKSLDWDPETRSSLDGYVPSKYTFEDWLKTKSPEFIEEYLGRGRSELFLAGKINMTDLLNKSGKTLTLKELRKKYE